MAKAFATSTDIVELPSRQLLRGSIGTTELRFAPANRNCSKPDTLDVQEDSISRVVLDPSTGKHVVFIKGKKVVGKLCDLTIEFSGEGGPSSLPVPQIKDMIWRTLK
jgi:hypothetical protein